MKEANNAIDSSIQEIDTLKRTLKKNKTRQVTAIEEKNIIKSTASAWFNDHFGKVSQNIGDAIASDVNNCYKELFIATDKATSRNSYFDILKAIRTALLDARKNLIGTYTTIKKTSDYPPDFSSLINDKTLANILRERWLECSKCLNANAPLAATVMMGGLLETLLLSRINREVDKKPIFTAKSAPKDKKTKKTMPLNEWTLRDYIDVAHELNWITRSAKDVGEVLRDYRNYIHPYKQHAHRILLETDDALLLWEIAKNISIQLLERVKEK